MGKKYIRGYGDGFQAGWESAMRQAQGLVSGGVDTSSEYVDEAADEVNKGYLTVPEVALRDFGALVVDRLRDAGGFKDEENVADWLDSMASLSRVTQVGELTPGVYWLVKDLVKRF